MSLKCEKWVAYFVQYKPEKHFLFFFKIKSLMFVWEINTKAALRTYTLFLINTINCFNLILRSDTHTYRLVMIIKVFRFQTEYLIIILKKFHFFFFYRPTLIRLYLARLLPDSFEIFRSDSMPSDVVVSFFFWWKSPPV